MKAWILGVAAGLNGRATSRSVQLFWPVINNVGQYGQTRPVGDTERQGLAGLANEKECALCQHAR